MTNIDRAYEVEHGFLVDGGPFYTGGPSSPVGLDLPTNTFYVQDTGTGVLLWEKHGPLATEWKLYSAQKISMDPAGILNLDPADTNVFLALQRLGNISVGDITQAEGFTSAAQNTTTSNGWVSKIDFPVTTANVKTAGKFSIRWSSEVGQTKATRNFGFRVRWRPTGGTWANLGSVDLAVSRDNNLFMQSGFSEVVLPTDNTIEIDIQHGQTTDGFASIIQNVSVEVRRIGDA